MNLRRYPVTKSRNTLTLPDNQIAQDFQRAFEDNCLLVENIKFVVFQRGYSLTRLSDELHRVGIKFSRSSFLQRRKAGWRGRYPSLLMLSTFALILEVPTWMLLSEDIERDWDAYLNSQVL